MDLLQKEVIQHLIKRAGARLTAGYGAEAADGFQSELRPYLAAGQRGNPAVFNAEARTALEAMVWPDGTLEHEESLLRVERLVALVRTRHENSPEELHTGIA